MLCRTGQIAACLGMLAFGVRAAQPPLKLDDPAEPELHRLTSVPAVFRPRAHPRVKAFREPRPLPAGAVTSDWPTFLGPTHNAVSPETRLLKDFTAPPGGAARPALVWQMVKGESYSAPAVVGERLVVFHRIGNEEVVECLHAERGTLYWQLRYPTTYTDRFGYNGGPRSTPAIARREPLFEPEPQSRRPGRTAGGRVFTYGAQGRLHCLDLRTGRVCWKRDLAREFKIRLSFFGAGSSPLVEGDLVILNIGGRDGPGVVALSARTGRLVWGAEKQWGAGYASPVPATIHGKRVVFVFAGGESDPPTGGLLCLDPQTGTTHFRFPWRSRRIYSVNASSPVVVGDTVFLSSIYDIGGALLRVSPKLTHTVVFRTEKYASHWMTPIVRGGYLYGFADAILVCMELKTGKVVWSTRPSCDLPAGAGGTLRKGGLGRASLLWADGAFLCLGEYGDLCWMDLSPKGMKITARAKLFHARQTWVCPVLSRGLLYVCQNEPDRRSGQPPRLLCYDLRGRQ